MQRTRALFLLGALGAALSCVGCRHDTAAARVARLEHALALGDADLVLGRLPELGRVDGDPELPGLKPRIASLRLVAEARAGHAEATLVALDEYERVLGRPATPDVYGRLLGLLDKARVTTRAAAAVDALMARATATHPEHAPALQRCLEPGYPWTLELSPAQFHELVGTQCTF